MPARPQTTAQRRQNTTPARVYFAYAFSPKHEFRFLAAFLSLTGSGQLLQPTSFAGVTFSPGQAVEGTYQFNSYRFTHRYRIYIRRALDVEDRGNRKDPRRQNRAAPGRTLGAGRQCRIRTARAPGRRIPLEPEVARELQHGRPGCPRGARLQHRNQAPIRHISRNWTLCTGYHTLEGGADTQEMHPSFTKDRDQSRFSGRPNRRRRSPGPPPATANVALKQTRQSPREFESWSSFRSTCETGSLKDPEVVERIKPVFEAASHVPCGAPGDA